MPSPHQRHGSWNPLLVTHHQHAGVLRPGRGVCKLRKGTKGQMDVTKLLNKYSPTTPPRCWHPQVQPGRPRAPGGHVPGAGGRALQRRYGTVRSRSAPQPCGVGSRLWQRGKVTRRQVSSKSCNKVYRHLSNRTQRHGFQRTCCTSAAHCLIPIAELDCTHYTARPEFLGLANRTKGTLWC